MALTKRPLERQETGDFKAEAEAKENEPKRREIETVRREVQFTFPAPLLFHPASGSDAMADVHYVIQKRVERAPSGWGEKVQELYRVFLTDPQVLELVRTLHTVVPVQYACEIMYSAKYEKREDFDDCESVFWPFNRNMKKVFEAGVEATPAVSERLTHTDWQYLLHTEWETIGPILFFGHDWPDCSLECEAALQTFAESLRDEAWGIMWG